MSSWDHRRRLAISSACSTTASVATAITAATAPAPVFNVEATSQLAGKAALATTFFHWGIHPWGIYALVSLALAFFAYNRGLPLTFRSVFYPLLGERIYGPWGNVIDILTVLATLFGLATSLGFGVGQAAAGLNFLFGWPDTPGFQVLLIVVITGMATASVVAGLDGVVVVETATGEVAEVTEELALGFGDA